METNTPNWKHLVLPVGFVLACVVLTILAMHSFGGVAPLEPRGYRLEVPLVQASNLLEGSDVQMSGIDIGRVVSVTRSGDGAVATLELEAKYAPLRSGATALARTKTLLGEGYLQIAPGPLDAPAIPEGGRLAADHVRRTVQLDEFLQTFDPHTRRRFHELFAGLARAYGGPGARALNDALGNAAPFSAGAETVLSNLNRQGAQLQRLFARSAEMLEAAAARPGALRAAITSGNDVLEVTGRRDRELEATIRALPAFLRQLRHTSSAITGASDDVNRAVAALLPVAPLVRPTLARLVADAPEFRSLFRELPPTLHAGTRGLPALTRILRSVPAAFRELYPTAREITPLMQLLADYRVPALIGPLASGGSAFNGKKVGPGGKIVTRGGGAVYVSNESIGGWVKRLPTDRSNPYPKPDGLAAIGKRGFLSSYDCRNLKNREYVPPTGSGVPPCVLQGPWEYNGHSAYYPRLSIAPP